MNTSTIDPRMRAMELAGLTAEIVLKRVGTLLPFAIGVTPTLEKKTYTMTGGTGDEKQFNSQVVDAVRADAEAGAFAALAFAGPVEVTHPTTRKMVKAICVQVEAPGATPMVAFRSYKKTLFGIKFGDLPPTSEPPPFPKVFG